MHGIPSSEDGAETTTDLTLALPATVFNLTQVLLTLDQYAAQRNLDGGVAARLRIIVEELVTNTIKYGYHGESAEQFRVRLNRGPGLELIYEDDAPAFDPLAWHDRWLSAEQVDDELIGQRGIPLIMGLAGAVRYQYREGGNRLIFSLADKPEPG